MSKYKYERIDPDSPEHAELVIKCQENWWLQYGGIPWQDDPFLEEYPFDFSRTDEMAALQKFFQKGNYAIRQGILYHDLAFIQQDSGGDEWWTLKRDGNEWVAFESWSFGSVEWYERPFSSAIASMELATVQQCKSLTYGLPENDMLWRVGEPGECPWDECAEDGRWCIARDKEYELHIYEQSDGDGFKAEVFSISDNRLLFSQEAARDALNAACVGVDWTKEYRKSGESELFRARTQESAIERAAALRESARALAAQHEDKGKDRAR